MWTTTDRRVGMCSAAVLVLLSVMYIVTGAIWLGFSMSGVGVRGLEPSEPFLTILESSDLNFIFRHFSGRTASAAFFTRGGSRRSCRRPGKFWLMHDVLFEHQRLCLQSRNLTTEDIATKLRKIICASLRRNDF